MLGNWRFIFLPTRFERVNDLVFVCVLTHRSWMWLTVHETPLCFLYTWPWIIQLILPWLTFLIYKTQEWGLTTVATFQPCCKLWSKCLGWHLLQCIQGLVEFFPRLAVECSLKQCTQPCGAENTDKRCSHTDMQEQNEFRSEVRLLSHAEQLQLRIALLCILVSQSERTSSCKLPGNLADLHYSK